MDSCVDYDCSAMYNQRTNIQRKRDRLHNKSAGDAILIVLATTGIVRFMSSSILRRRTLTASYSSNTVTASAIGGISAVALHRKIMMMRMEYIEPA